MHCSRLLNAQMVCLTVNNKSQFSSSPQASQQVISSQQCSMQHEVWKCRAHWRSSNPTPICQCTLCETLLIGTSNYFHLILDATVHPSHHHSPSKHYCQSFLAHSSSIIAPIATCHSALLSRPHRHSNCGTPSSGSLSSYSNSSDRHLPPPCSATTYRTIFNGLTPILMHTFY